MSWRVELDHTGKKAVCIRCDADERDTGTVICEMISSRGIEETRNNAFVMAAAPELLDSLKRLVGVFRMTQLLMDAEGRKQARELIDETNAVIALAKYP